MALSARLGAIYASVNTKKTIHFYRDVQADNTKDVFLDSAINYINPNCSSLIYGMMERWPTKHSQFVPDFEVSLLGKSLSFSDLFSASSRTWSDRPDAKRGLFTKYHL